MTDSQTAVDITVEETVRPVEKNNADNVPDVAAFWNCVEWFALNSHRWRWHLIFLIFRCFVPLLFVLHQLLCYGTVWMINFTAANVFGYAAPGNYSTQQQSFACRHQQCEDNFMFSVTSLWLTLLLYSCAWLYQLYKHCRVTAATDTN